MVPDINTLIATVKDTDCFKNLHNTKTAKQTVRKCLTNWTNFKKALNAYKKDSSKFRRMPKPPYYKDKLAHCISKYLVAKAKDTNCAIALEDLSGINSRTTVRKKQRSERLSWAFYQLRSFITYKAVLAGVPVILVDPRYTSQRCNACGHTEKANRKKQAEFVCKSCGHTDHADCNGAKNIRDKGLLSISLSVSAKKLLSVA
jgi:IS605 OrfB family transposase